LKLGICRILRLYLLFPFSLTDVILGFYFKADKFIFSVSDVPVYVLVSVVFICAHQPKCFHVTFVSFSWACRYL